MPWYIWALMTVICWGTYGVCMHTGSMKMESPEHGRIMAFLWVGIGLLTAVIAPIIILKLKGGPIDFWAYPAKGWQWSLIAGTLGAIGALGVLLRLGGAKANRRLCAGDHVDHLCRCADRECYCQHDQGQRMG